MIKEKSEKGQNSPSRRDGASPGVNPIQKGLKGLLTNAQQSVVKRKDTVKEDVVKSHRSDTCESLMSGDSSVESALENAATFGLDGEKLIHNRLDLNNTIQLKKNDTLSKKLPKFN